MPPDRPPETDPGLTPSTVDEIKQRNVKSIQDKLRNYRKISTFRLAEMGAGTLGIVSGIASIATGALGATQRNNRLPRKTKRRRFRASAYAEAAVAHDEYA